jgi:cytochrome c5
MKLNMKLPSILLGAGVTLLTCLFAGCQSSTQPVMLSETGAKSGADSAAAAAPAKGRAQIWSQTCNRCHNTRSPDSYSGREWSIVMTHMRVRGYLTGEDQRAILEFLQQQ